VGRNDSESRKKITKFRKFRKFRKRQFTINVEKPLVL
jgi:hypothetical protein